MMVLWMDSLMVVLKVDSMAVRKVALTVVMKAAERADWRAV